MTRIGIECESIEGSQIWGVGRQINKLLQELAKRPELENEFKFFLYFKAQIPEYSYLNSDLFVKRLVKVPLMPISFSLYYYVYLPIRLYFEKLDLMIFPNYMLPIIFRGQSLVALTSDVYYESKSGAVPWRYKLAYRIFGTWAAKHATRLLTYSHASKQDLTGLYRIDPDRIVVNEHGSDAIIRKIVPNNRGDYILYVGQAFPRRHLRETILAFKKIAAEFRQLKLIAIGADKYSPPIIGALVKQINSRLGRQAVVHEVFVSDEELAGLYQNAKLLIYISSKETFGLPPLEALGYGVPSVVADTDVTREIFDNSAFFVGNPDSIDAIAAAITDGLQNQRKRDQITRSAIEILSKYTWSGHADRFLRIIREMTHGKAA